MSSESSHLSVQVWPAVTQSVQVNKEGARCEAMVRRGRKNGIMGKDGDDFKIREEGK